MSPWDASSGADPLDVLSTAENEQRILGTLLTVNKSFDLIADLLSVEHFSDPLCARIFADATRMIAAGTLVNIDVLRGPYKAEGLLADVGGERYLAALVSAAASRGEVRPMASVIVDRWRRRSLIAAAGEMQRRALEGLPDLNGANIASDLAADFARLADDNMRDNFASLADGFAAVIEEARRAAERGGNPDSLNTGFQSLDDLLNGGFEPGQLIVLAGRTRMGKTVVAQEFTLAAARAGKGVAFFSLDTSLKDLLRRFVIGLSGIPLRALRRGDLHQSQWGTLVETQQTFGKLPITIDDKATPTVAEIRLRTRRIARRHPVGMIVVDHLDYIARPKGLEREGKVTATGANTGALKALAKEFGVPVVLLVQVSRTIDHRTEKRPVLADLSWSGSIEQDADAVIFVHREEAYGTGGSGDRRPGETDTEFQRRQVQAGAAVEASKGKGELIVAKQRQGASGIVHIRFDGAGFRATDAGPGDAP